MAGKRVRPPRRQGRQPPAVAVVGAECPGAEVRPQPSGRELDPRALLDVAGEEPQDDALGRVEPPHQIGHTRQQRHALPVADFLHEPARVALEAVAEPRVDRLGCEACRPHEVGHDARIGLAAEVVAIDEARGSVDPQERGAERTTARALGEHEGAVDVEEDETHGR